MAKSKGRRRGTRTKSARPRSSTARSGKRQSATKAKSARRPAKPAKRLAKPANRLTKSAKRPAKPAARAKTRAARTSRDAVATGKRPRLDRARRILDDTVPSPPSSLNLTPRASAARSGRIEIQEGLHDHTNMAGSEITAGDVDVNVEDAYFAGEEAPGGDNPTPDQDIVDDIGKALGLQYQDNEELKSADKVIERDKHRWELDPASAEDYKDRK